MVWYEDYFTSKEWYKLYHSKYIEVFSIDKNSRKKTYYYNIPITFDIETTTVKHTVKQGKKEKVQANAYMYIWQMCIGDTAIYGSTWGEWQYTIDKLKDLQERHQAIKIGGKNGKYRTKKATCKFLGLIHNIAFEFQFFRFYVNITNSFFKDERKPLFIEIENCIRFLDSFQITHMSLDKMAKEYNLPTKKMVGDLDYTVLRNSQAYKTMTEEELRYCENDVLVLRDYFKFYINYYVKGQGYMPLTQTSQVRFAISDEFSKQTKYTYSDIEQMQPPTQEEYNKVVNWLFRGGFTHANAYKVSKKLPNITGVDFTSSYPSVISKEYAPMSKFVDVTEQTDKYKFYLCRFCCIIDATFYNIRSTTEHTIESISKCECKGEVQLDNGRVRTADKLRAVLTELDYANYKDFYEWDYMVIHSFKIAVRDNLPDYVIVPMLKAYETKAKLKANGKSYVLEKSIVNSFYGCTVTKKHELNISLDKDGNYVTEPQDYNIKKDMLSVYWGCWITAHARRNELMTLKLLGNDVVYSDTDSHKLLNYEKHKEVIENYNKVQIQKNIQLCKKYNLDFSLVGDLGLFDNEYGVNNCTLMTLGAKRYIYTLKNQKDENKNGFHSTIAGLPKKAYKQYCDDNGLDYFDTFKDDLFIPNCKTTTQYNDTVHSDIVNGEQMLSLSSVAIIDISFTMNLSDDYTEWLEYISKIIRRKK